MIGVGIRLVQDIGRHRKRMYSNMDLVEAEQWRRAFWLEPQRCSPMTIGL